MVKMNTDLKNLTKGFTLLELLIAMAIFSIIAYIGFAGIRQISQHGVVLLAKETNFARLQRTIAIIENDFLQMTHRTTRNIDGVFVPAMQMLNVNEIEFSRDGNYSFDKTMQSSLLRVKYSFDGTKLNRTSWSNMDRVTEDAGIQQIMLEEVTGFSLDFLGLGDWVKAWPERTACVDASGRNTSLPRMIKITLDTKNFGTITRVIPGVSQQNTKAGCTQKYS